MINRNAWWMQETARLCHRLGFVSVLTHGPQLDIDVLKICNASVRLVHHNCHNYHTKVTKYVLLVIYINYTDLIRLLKVPIIFFYFISFLTSRCARHGVTAYMQLRLCQLYDALQNESWYICQLLFWCGWLWDLSPLPIMEIGGRRDRTVVVFTTTYAISLYQH
jgi:hypothetical protein